MEGVYRAVAVGMSRKNRVDFLHHLLLFLLSVCFAAVLGDVDKNPKGKLGSIVDYLEAEHHQQIPKLNAGNISSQDDPVLEACDKQRQLQEDHC